MKRFRLGLNGARARWGVFLGMVGSAASYSGAALGSSLRRGPTVAFAVKFVFTGVLVYLVSSVVLRDWTK